MKKNIIVAEDDLSLLPMISYNLKKNNFSVREARNGEEANILIREQIPDLVILDWMMPEPNGIELCKMLRINKNTKNLPIIILTAKEEEGDKVHGLNSGADDYIVKPFSPSELIARVQALLRRSGYLSNSKISYGDIEVDIKSLKVFRKKKRINLGPIELKILRLLITNPESVFSREQLLNRVWGHEVFIEQRTVDTHIRRLRKAINIDNCEDIIRTVRGSGYSIDLEKNS